MLRAKKLWRCVSPNLGAPRFFSSVDCSSVDWRKYLLDEDEMKVRREASSLASSAGKVFDRPAKFAQRSRAARTLDGSDTLFQEVSSRMMDRLDDCTRGFDTVAILGGAGEFLLPMLPRSRAAVKRLLYLDPSSDMLERVRRSYGAMREAEPGLAWPEAHFIQGDEETLPFKPRSLDAVISCLGLHWVNDLPGSMSQCRAALRPDGLFLAAMWGGETLQELRAACAAAEMEREGGVSQRTSPMAHVRDAGSLLGRAGLNLSTVDVDDIVIRYPGPVDLVEHLRNIGEGNASSQRRPHLPRDTALAAAALYGEMFGGEGEGEGRGVEATFQVIYMTGWSPSELQQRPSQRGTATVSLHDLDTVLKDKGGVSGSLGDERGDEGTAGR